MLVCIYVHLCVCDAGWRAAARVLAHCPVHGREALALLLGRVPLGAPETPELVVDQVLRWYSTHILRNEDTCVTCFPLF